MHWFKADLHIHTVLSPCGGLGYESGEYYQAGGIEKVGHHCHNRSQQHRTLQNRTGDRKKTGITVLQVPKLNTKEEIHCLAFFENIDKAEQFQQYIDENLTVIANNPEIFGNQYVVDEYENILEEENRLLVASLEKRD